jgi:pSer/pThr/pTyr-binding forkhead associated (FHA) protein
VNVEGIGALISEELDGFSEQTDSVVMDIARADEELKLPYRTNLYVEVVEGPDQGKKVQFPKGNMVIGRLNADVVLKDSDISRRHALIEAYTRDKIFIKDLASTNGTFVNGQKVTYDKLKHGDKIRVGKSILKFVVEELK